MPSFATELDITLKQFINPAAKLPRQGLDFANLAVTVTLIDVAHEAKVSPSTVSRYLNGTARLSEEKRLAVDKAIKLLNFKPNLSARSLKTGTTMTVGILTQDIESSFFTRGLRGVEVGLEGSGYAPIIVSGQWDAKEEAERIELLIARRVDGLVILTGRLDDAEIAQFARYVPIVVVGRKIDAPNVLSTSVNQELGGYLATQHLIGLGHRRIAHIAGPEHNEDAQGRQLGYRRALLEAGIDSLPELYVQGDFMENGGLLAMNQLLDQQQFTAVFAANDQTAIGARVAMYRRGVRVPEDISLIGMDDLPATAYCIPPLTTVRQPIYEMGLSAAHDLLKLMGRDAKKLQVPELEIVARDSTRRV
jgi:LacI family transcriptional regulator